MVRLWFGFPVNFLRQTAVLPLLILDATPSPQDCPGMVRSSRGMAASGKIQPSLVGTDIASLDLASRMEQSEARIKEDWCRC